MSCLPNTRKAMMMVDVKTIEQKEIPMPDLLESTDVLVQIKAVGICGSDVNYFAHGGSTFAKVRYPHILGHEAAGVIVAVGDDVKNLCAGDRVAIEPGVPCGECDLCKAGKYNLCRDVSFMGIPIYKPYSEGAFVEYTIRPASWVYKLPDSVTFEEGAMIEPLSVGMQAVSLCKVQAGQTALVLGCGPISLCVMLSLRAVGIHTVFMVDIDKPRTEIAKNIGAMYAFNALDDDAKRVIMDETSGKGVDLVFDTTNYMPLVNDSFNYLNKAGEVVLIGVPHDDYISIHYRELFMRQATLHTSFRYANQYPSAIRLVSQGVIPIGKIITHSFAFDRTQEAFELALNRGIPTEKVVVTL
jgi:L-iditol 2-dehydrogenase